jgi:MFS family permease
MYSIGIVIFSPFAGQMSAKLGGKRNALQVSVLVLGISIVSFGFLAFVKEKNAILSLALGNRLL